MKKDKIPLNKFLIKLIITTAPGVYATNLTATWKTTFYQNLVELSHFALQHRSSYSATLLKSFLHTTGTSIQQIIMKFPVR